jgi:hypothetical protein
MHPNSSYLLSSLWRQHHHSTSLTTTDPSLHDGSSRLLALADVRSPHGRTPPPNRIHSQQTNPIPYTLREEIEKKREKFEFEKKLPSLTAAICHIPGICLVFTYMTFVILQVYTIYIYTVIIYLSYDIQCHLTGIYMWYMEGIRPTLSYRCQNLVYTHLEPCAIMIS